MDQLMHSLEQSLFIGVSFIVYIAFVCGSIFYTSFDLHLIPKQRSNIYYVLQRLTVYAAFLFITLFYAYIVPLELFAIDRLTSEYIYTFLAGVLLIVIAWIYKAFTTRTFNLFITVVVHMVAMFPLFLLFLQEHVKQIESGKAHVLDHLLNLPTIATLLFYFSIVLYTRQQYDVISYGQVDRADLRGRSLRLLYSLDDHRQVLQAEQEAYIHYIYHLQNDTYHRYDLVPRSGHRHTSRRKRRAMPSLPAEVAATKEEFSPVAEVDAAVQPSSGSPDQVGETSWPPRATRHR